MYCVFFLGLYTYISLFFYLFLVQLHFHICIIIYHYYFYYLPFCTTSLAWTKTVSQINLWVIFTLPICLTTPPSLNHSFTSQPGNQQLLPPPVKPLSRHSLPELFRDRCEHLQAGTSGPESPGRWPLVKTLSVWRTAATLKGADTPPKPDRPTFNANVPRPNNTSNNNTALPG